MLLTPDCIMCNYKAALSALRQLGLKDSTVRELVEDIFRIPALRGQDWSQTSPEVFELVFTKILATVGERDPFRELKARQNRKALELYPRVKELVAQSEDPLHTAVNLAIIGNSLDLMWSEGSVDIEPILEEKLERPVPDAHYRELLSRLEGAKLVLFFGDNSGEILFDRLLIETIKQSFDVDVYFVVRSVPTLNDATLEEAKMVGLDTVATVVENGIDGPLPGTVLSRCSQEVRDLVQQADLIISKGGGNFDTLEEEGPLLNDIFFLLMCKCVPYHRYFDTALADPVLWTRSAG